MFKNKIRIKIMALATAILMFASVTTASAATITWQSLAKKRIYSQAEVKWVVGKCAIKYGLSSSDTTWLKTAAVDIIFSLPGRPAHESGGDTHAGAGRTCQGIVQFNKAWCPTYYGRKLINTYEPWHKYNWRMSGLASLDRMTKLMHDRGKAGIRQHWKATLNR